MAEEFIIGREGNQPFPIPHKGLPSSSDSVHRQHAKIMIDNYGNWTLEDLKGPEGNGTYIRDEIGNFKRVYKTRIDEDTVIRLGSEGQHGFTFMAHHVLVSNPDDYSYEFRKTKEYFGFIAEQNGRIQKKKDIQSFISKYLFSVIGLIISVFLPNLLISFFPQYFTEVDKFNLIRLSFIIPSVAIGPFLNANKDVRVIKNKSDKMLVCPKCQRPLSKYDINNQLCPSCKAH